MGKEQERKKSPLSLPEAAELLLPPGNLSEKEMGLLESSHAKLLEQAWTDIMRESKKDVNSPESVEVRTKWARIFLGYWYWEVIRYTAALLRNGETSIADDGTIDFEEGETLNVSLTHLSDTTPDHVLRVKKSTPLEVSKLTAVSEPEPGMPSVTVVSEVESPEADRVIKYMVFIGERRNIVSCFVSREIVSETEGEPRVINDGTLLPLMLQPPLYPLT